MAERWFFYQDSGGLWKWARLDVLGTILDHSGVSFETRDVCLDHARAAGYNDGRAEHGVAVPHDAKARSAQSGRDQTA